MTTAVCVAGMHRSGTSMITHMLNVAGLYLGDPVDLVGPAQDNEEGFWENREFTRINHEILTLLNGAWDLPPSLPLGWELDSRLEPFYATARTIIAKFDKHPLWGWKDPRSSLTLAFWQRLIPELKVIVCLRNPFEVTQSLAKRGYASKVFGMNLWSIYNKQVLAHTTPQNRIVTNYESYFFNPQAELERVLSFLRLESITAEVQAACDTVMANLRHNRLTVDTLPEDRMSQEILDFYAQLCKEAGPIFQASSVAPFEPKPVLPKKTRYTQNIEDEIRSLQQAHQVQAQTLQQVQTELTDLQQKSVRDQESISRLQKETAWRTAQMHQLDYDLQALRSTLTVRASRELSELIKKFVSKK